MPSFFDQVDPQGAQNDLQDRALKQTIVQRILAEANRPAAPAPQFPQFYTPERVNSDLDQIRRGRAAGGLLQATGDQGLSALGKTLAAGKTPEEYMQNAAQQEQVRRYQQWQADEAARGGKDRVSALSSTLSALGRGGDGYQNVPLGAIRDMANGAYQLSGLKGVVDGFDPRFQQVYGKYTSVFRDIAPWSVRNGLESIVADLARQGATPEEIQNVKDSANWWAEFHRVWIAPGRHELFGATLTDPEKAAWENLVSITSASDPQEVQRRIEQLYNAKLDNERRRAKPMARVYGRQVLEDAYGNLLDYPEGASPSADGADASNALLNVERAKPAPTSGEGGVSMVHGIPVRVLHDDGSSTVVPATPQDGSQTDQYEVDGITARRVR